MLISMKKVVFCASVFMLAFGNVFADAENMTSSLLSDIPLGISVEELLKRHPPPALIRRKARDDGLLVEGFVEYTIKGHPFFNKKVFSIEDSKVTELAFCYDSGEEAPSAIDDEEFVDNLKALFRLLKKELGLTLRKEIGKYPPPPKGYWAWYALYLWEREKDFIAFLYTPPALNKETGFFDYRLIIAPTRKFSPPFAFAGCHYDDASLWVDETDINDLKGEVEAVMRNVDMRRGTMPEVVQQPATWKIPLLIGLVVISGALLARRPAKENPPLSTDGQGGSKFRRFIKKAGGVAVFTVAVLLPLCVLIIEATTGLCARMGGFNPLVTPWHIAMVAVVPVGNLLLWLSVQGKVRVSGKRFHALAVMSGVTLTFAALFAFLLESHVFDALESSWLTFLLVLLYSLVLFPLFLLVHSPLLALVGGFFLFRRLNGTARQQGIFLGKSFCVGTLAGLGVVLVFFHMDFAAIMNTGYLQPIRVSKNHAAKVAKWRTEAERGDAEAQLRLGMCYATGKGVERDIEVAAEWYQKANRQNHAMSHCFVGGHYFCHHGYSGVSMGNARKKPAKSKDSRNQFHLGERYLTGHGVEVNIEKAVAWFAKAAEQGHLEAQYILERYDKNGTISPRDASDALGFVQALIKLDGNEESTENK